MQRLPAVHFKPELPELGIHPVPDPAEVVHLVVMRAAERGEERFAIRARPAVVDEQLPQIVLRANQAGAIARQYAIAQAREVRFIAPPVFVTGPAQPARVDFGTAAGAPERALQGEHKFRVAELPRFSARVVLDGLLGEEEGCYHSRERSSVRTGPESFTDRWAFARKDSQMETKTTLDVTPLPEWMTTAEVAAHLGKSIRHVQKMAQRRELKTKRADRPGVANNALLYSGESLKAYLEKKEEPEPSSNPEAVRRREAREKQRAPIAVIAATGARYKSLTLILRGETGSTRVVLGNPERGILFGNKLTASLVRMHEYAIPAPTEEVEGGEAAE